MKRKYSHDFAPPAPVVDVVVRAPGGPNSATLPGKLDTGADVCGVPIALIAHLDIPPVRTSRASGVAGGMEEVIVYRVDLDLAGVSLRRLEAIATRRPYVIIGRNALRGFVLRLDGPREAMELRVAGSRRR